MSGALDLLAALAAVALVAVVAFRTGIWWTKRKAASNYQIWVSKMGLPPCAHAGGFPSAAPGWRHDCLICGAAHIARDWGPLDIRWERLPDSSPTADGVPGDNPAGVSIPPTTVPPAGAPDDALQRRAAAIDAQDRQQAAHDFCPQSRGR